VLELKKHTYGIRKLKNILIEIINNLERRETMITVARLHKIDNGSVLKAFADIIINNEVLVKSVQVLSGEGDDLFVSMPKQKSKNDKWYETVSLLDEEAKEELQVVVLEAYEA
jgi:DNA-binding cell septation regulator SpoVG